MQWMAPSAIASLGSAIILCGVYWYLFVVYRTRYLAIWTAAWALYALRFAGMLVVLATGDSPLLEAINRVTSLATGLLLVGGTMLFIGRPIRPWLLALGLLGFGWIATTLALGASTFVIETPAYTLVAAAHVWLGVALARSPALVGRAKVFTGVSLVLWGIHKADFPLLYTVEWLAPWGYLVSAALATTTAVGMLLTYFERIRHDLATSHHALREREERLRAIFDAAVSTAFVICDRERRIVDVSPGAELMLGYGRQDAVGRPFALLVPETGAGEPSPANEVMLRRRSGEEFPAMLTLHPLRDDAGDAQGTLAVAIDLTHRKELEDRLRQSQKLQAIGTLAGGIAHDFNNILTAVLGNAEVLRERLAGAERAIADEIVSAALRGRDLVQRILAFGRRSEGKRRPVQVAGVVDEALRLVTRSLPATVTVRRTIADCWVRADTISVQQVVMNLATNAYHAMRETGGVLEVAVEPVVVGAPIDSGRAALAPGRYVRLVFSDSGVGMSASTLARVFEPFFTTKPAGEGTGLGLAVVHGIVSGLGGEVTIRSELGRGTTVSVYLPEHSAAEHELPVAPAAPRGGERILIVDDEPTLVRVSTVMLQSLGYEVDGVTSPREALERVRRDPGAYDLVITDQTMPELTGEALAPELLRLRPELPVVVCTGFSDSLDERRALELGFRAFLMKPYTGTELATVVRQALDGAATTVRPRV